MFTSITYCLLGCLIFGSLIVPITPCKADSAPLVEIRAKAEQGDISAQLKLGAMYMKGQNVTRNYIEAAKWIGKAATQGEVVAQLELGMMYVKGRGVEQNYAESVNWFRRSAEQGNATAQLQLGLMYANGTGVERNQVEAMAWLRKAAEQGEATAQGFLGKAYSHGRLRDDIESLKWIRKAADQGNGAAQYHLGQMYTTGMGVPRDDAEGAKWLRKAAEHNVSTAVMTCNGPVHSMARHQVKEPLVERGLLTEKGKQIRRAAQRGDAQSQCRFGQMYFAGKIGRIDKGVTIQGRRITTPDFVEAYKWIALARAQDEKVEGLLNLLESQRMTPEQIQEAQKRAAAWHPSLDATK